MQYVTARQAADMTGQSERTIRRMIKAGKLKARHVAPNRYEIAVEDLPRKKRDPLGELRGQVEALERRVRTLEAQNSRQTRQDAILSEQGVTDLSPHSYAPVSRPSASTARGSSAGYLPDGYVPVDRFAQEHGMRASQRTTWLEAARSGRLPVQYKQGGWRHANPQGKVALVWYALDADGRRVFCELWRDTEWFTPCEECPHE